MAGGIYGGDLAQMQALKTQFDRAQEQVRTLENTVSGAVSNTAWSGPRADRFRSAWQSEYRPALQKIALALQEAGIAVDRNRQNIQDVTS